MKINKEYSQPDVTDVFVEIEKKGMIYIIQRWVPIETVVQVYKETDLAFFGNVTVYECDHVRRIHVLFEKNDTWIPISMSDNPWWICTKMFNHPGKVANKRFDEYD